MWYKRVASRTTARVKKDTYVFSYILKFQRVLPAQTAFEIPNYNHYNMYHSSFFCSNYYAKVFKTQSFHSKLQSAGSTYLYTINESRVKKENKKISTPEEERSVATGYMQCHSPIHQEKPAMVKKGHIVFPVGGLRGTGPPPQAPPPGPSAGSHPAERRPEAEPRSRGVATPPVGPLVQAGERVRRKAGTFPVGKAIRTPSVAAAGRRLGQPVRPHLHGKGPTKKATIKTQGKASSKYYYNKWQLNFITTHLPKGDGREEAEQAGQDQGGQHQQEQALQPLAEGAGPARCWTRGRHPRLRHLASGISSSGKVKVMLNVIN